MFSGAIQAIGSAQVIRQWESIKRAEKGARSSVMDGLPSAFPALLLAQKVQKKAARVGFDWDDAFAGIDKVEEEIERTATRRSQAKGGRPSKRSWAISSLAW